MNNYEIKILKAIEENAVFGFTGRINILTKKQTQFIGQVIMVGGDVVDANFRSQIYGMDGIFSLVVYEIDSIDGVKAVAEPEVVELKSRPINLSLGSLIFRVESFFKNYLRIKKLRPAADLKLLIHPGFFRSDISLSGNEFDILCTIFEWPRVGDIYAHAGLLEYETTEVLVSLREKGVLKVCK